MKDTLIEWCDDTDNIVEGCDEAAPECANCYARDVAARFHEHHYEGIATRSGKRGLPMWTGNVALRPELLEKRTRALFNNPTLRRIFWVSMGDLMHKEVPDTFIDQAFGAAAVNPQHVFIVVTKRPERAEAYTNAAGVEGRVRIAAEQWWGLLAKKHRRARESPFAWSGWPVPNIHLLASAGSQATADKFVPALGRAKAAVRGISCEPLIAPVRFDAWLDYIDWLIVGGESGRKARPCELSWMLDVVQPARQHGHPRVFVKQMGRILARKMKMRVPLLEPDKKGRTTRPDTKGKAFDLFPPELQVRQFPDPQPAWSAA